MRATAQESNISQNLDLTSDNQIFKDLLEAANQGDAEAQFNLGTMYDNGERIAQDYKKALEWYIKAAEQGHSEAQTNLGLLYESGHGVPQDYKKAVEWYAKAASQGLAMAQCNLGGMYDTGRGISKDYKKAFEWYAKAAEQGFAKAQYNLGGMYDTGEGVSKDYKKAFEWYSEAANQGHALAQSSLGSMYEKGEGVVQDNAKAIEWYTKAAEQGDSLAKSNLKAIKSEGKDRPNIFGKLLHWLQPKKETFPDANIRQLSSFTDVLSVLETLPSDALVIFDLDETLVVNRDENLPPALTESFTPNLIKNLQEKGIKTIALTNTMTSLNLGDSSQEEFRHRELLRVGIDFSKSFQEFFIFNDLPIYDGHYPIFSKGIIYTNRIPKGKVLAAFLEKMKDTLKPSLIIFFDDKPENILDVKKAVEERNMKYIGFVYNKITDWLDGGMSYEDIHKKLLPSKKLVPANVAP